MSNRYIHIESEIDHNENCVYSGLKMNIDTTDADEVSYFMVELLAVLDKLNDYRRLNKLKFKSHLKEMFEIPNLRDIEYE